MKVVYCLKKNKIMETKKLYTDNKNIMCFSLEYWKEYIERNKLKELKLELMKGDWSNNFRYCAHHLEVVERACNWNCQEYSPLNNKSGRCRFYKPALIGSNRFYLLTQKGLRKWTQ